MTDHLQPPPLLHVLVIDEMPLISVGLQTVFRSIHPAIRVEHTDSVFNALSSHYYKDRDFHLVILGSGEEHDSPGLLLNAAGLKARFTDSRIMIYTDRYDPELLAKTIRGIIDACVHKHEPAEEIRKAYARLSIGETYLSCIFDTLYHSYRLNL